jgi:hypothetical protein
LGPKLSSFSFSPTQIDTTNTSQVVTLTIQVTDESGVLGGYFPEIRSVNGCSVATRGILDWFLVSGDRKAGTWMSSVTVSENAYCPGNIRVTSGFWRDEWNNFTWGITASQTLSVFNSNPAICGNFCSQKLGESTNGGAVGSGQTGTTRIPTYETGRKGTTPIPTNTTGQASTATISTTVTAVSTTRAGATEKSSATTVPRCTSTPNATRGSDIRCSDGSSATATQNVFGGQDVYKTGTGNKILTTKPNALGGFDITSNGQKTTTRPNVFGGQDYYQNGKKVATTKPNGIGGIDVYRGNNKVQTCSGNAKGKQTCR